MTAITVAELMEVLETLPPKSTCPIVRGRLEAEIFASIPETEPIPKGWTKAAELVGYYPEGMKRVKWVGL